MTDTAKPRDGKDVEDAVRWALAGGKALEVVGRSSKRALGRPSQTDLTLDLSGLTGVTLYEPAELVLSAKAGTPIAEIEALLAEHNQQQRVKCAFDEKGLLNPGKVFPKLHRCAELGRMHISGGKLPFPDIPRF